MKIFRIHMEWMRNDSIAVPAERALFGRLTIHVDDDCVSQLRDSWHGAVADGPYVSVYPLLNWMLANWWSLRFEPCHSKRPSEEFLMRHSWMAVSGPYSLPGLTTWREDDRMMLEVEPSRSRFHEAHFQVSGKWTVPVATFELELARLIEASCDRLRQFGLGDDPVVDCWREITSLTSEEREYCGACGRIGLEPGRIPDELAEELIRTAELPAFKNTRFAAEFLDSESAVTTIFEDAQKVSRAVDQLSSAGCLRDVRRAEEAILPFSVSPGRPYEAGYRAAQELRSGFGLSRQLGPPDLEAMFGWTPQGALALPRSGVALISRSPAGEIRVGAKVGLESSQRFGFCRAMFDALAVPRDLGYISTGYRLRDKASRAFSAEFLLSSEALRHEVETAGGIVDDEFVRAIAEKYKVSTITVSDQLTNHGLPVPAEAA